MSKKYDYVIVGAGIYGAVFAQQMKESGKSVLVLDARPHIAGNCYSENFQDTRINFHKYGTHIFHTNDQRTWDYVNRFTEFNHYRHTVLTTFQNRVYSMPINLGTINSFYGVQLVPSEVEAFLADKKTSISSPRNLEEKAISLIGRDLYEAFIRGYTLKQWQRDPKDLPASIITRLPVRNNYDASYFSDRYQGIPVDGYTPMFERMLEGVDIELGVDFFSDASYFRSRGRKLIYTGAVDRFFNHQHGNLTWRSVRFETEFLSLADYQGTSVMNYADEAIPWTRIHEPQHLHPERGLSNTPGTLLQKEFSYTNDKEPYYPVNSVDDKAMLAQYETMVQQERDVIFGGRLAEYKYYDMHQVVASALARVRRE
ncbi:MAG: UDP-galactopyranose mutase [Planctomycetota bacterium]|nr:MAG: UDP-galactopyranose mutase [Planctomycetota bacterium]